MIKQLIPLSLLFFFAFGLAAQVPKQVNVKGKLGKVKTAGQKQMSMMCNDAGTSTQTLATTAESNDIQFLCLGDTMFIEHFGGDLSGDPQPISPPGLVMSFIVVRLA